MKILSFLHTYAPDGEFDYYMVNVIAGFENIGAKLFVIKSNDLINLKRKKVDLFIKKIIKKAQPDLILSTNRSGISKSILENCQSIPIITLMVDLIFFKKSKFGKKTFFQKNDYLITPTLKSVKEFEKKFPVLKGRIYYLPFCTSKNDFNHGTNKDINISFVGNLFGKPTKIIGTDKNDQEFRDGVFKFIDDVKRNYHLDVDDHLKKYNLTQTLTARGHDSDKLFNLAANIISTNNRIKALDAVSDLGLKIYGPKKWFETISYSYKLASCYQFVEYIKTRQHLFSIYDRSKICINVNHHQATSGVGYRVFDVLASSALLITEFQEDSDLARLFGENHKIPTYRTPDELRNKAKYYLDHEDERIELVRYCNQLVAKGFSFEERATQMIQIAYPDFDPYANNQVKATFITIPKFYTWWI